MGMLCEAIFSSSHSLAGGLGLLADLIALALKPRFPTRGKSLELPRLYTDAKGHGKRPDGGAEPT